MQLLLNENIKKIIPLAEVFSKFLSFINILLMMKLLLIYDYADYAYLMTIVLWSSFVMDGGVNNLIFNKGLKNELEDVNLLFTGRVLLSSIVFIILSFFFITSKPELASSGIILTIIMFLTTSTTFIKMLSRGKGLYKVDFITIVTEPLIRLIIIGSIYIFFNTIKWKLWIFLLAYLAAGLISFSTSAIILSENFKIRFLLQKSNQIIDILKNTLVYSKYFLLIGLFHTINGRIEIIYIEKYIDKTNLALFSSANLLYEVILLFFFTIITSHFKLIYENNKKALFYFIISTIFIIIITILFAKPIIQIILPHSYLGSVEILKVIIFSLLPSVIVFYFIMELNFENKTYVSVLIFLIPIIVKLISYSMIKSSSLDFYKWFYTINEFSIAFYYLVYFGFNLSGLKKNKPYLKL
jgi:O-antigen/teichoic acid export membrane protein